MKDIRRSKSEIISTLIELNIDEPINIINIFNNDSKLIKNKCLHYDKKMFGGGINLNRSLFDASIDKRKECTLKPEMFC